MGITHVPTLVGYVDLVIPGAIRVVIVIVIVIVVVMADLTDQVGDDPAGFAVSIENEPCYKAFIAAVKLHWALTTNFIPG